MWERLAAGVRSVLKTELISIQVVFAESLVLVDELATGLAARGAVPNSEAGMGRSVRSPRREGEAEPVQRVPATQPSGRSLGAVRHGARHDPVAAERRADW
jgi:hypothetical protein